MVANGYLFLSMGILLLLFSGYGVGLTRSGISPKEKTKKLYLGGIISLIWFVYLYLLSSTSFLYNFDLPPRFPIAVFLPTVMLFFLFIKRNKFMLTAIPPAWFIYFQSFRIVVELLIHATVLEGILPKQASFTGYNYEIVIGLSAPIVALAFHKKWLSHKIVLVWNYIGLSTLGVIIFIVISSYYFPSIWGYSSTPVAKEFVQLPYLLLPGFLAPVAIFVHILSIMQLRKKAINN